MALKKMITDATGRTAEYWKIGSKEHSYGSVSTTDFYLHLYADQEKKEQGFVPIATEKHHVEGDLSRAQCYDYLKTLEQFEESEDV